MKKTVIFSIPHFGHPVGDYFEALGKCFVDSGYKVIYIFEGSPKELPEDTESSLYYNWPSIKPKKLKDILFFLKLVAKEKPQLCLSNFGSTNVVSLISFIFRIKNRINYVHTTTNQIKLDAGHSLIKRLFWNVSKRFVLRLNSGILTNSQGTKVDTTTNYFIPEQKVSVFPILIAPSLQKYRVREERDEAIVIVGRLHKSKGHDSLLRQFCLLVREYPNMKLIIVGDGHQKRNLENLVTELQIENNVVFAGFIQNSEIGKIFSKSLIGISASIYEAYGITNLESLREGTPIICTRTAGSKDILVEKYNGVFYSSEVNSALIDSVNTVLGGWDSYSINSIKTFNEKYSLLHIDKQFLRLVQICNLDV